MSIFDDVLAMDAQFLMQAEETSETVIYTPASPTVDNPVRSITAFITRMPPSPIGANANYSPPKMLALVENNATRGIASATVDTGGDTITVAYRLGTTAKAYGVKWPSNPQRATHDSAMISLELR